MNFAIRPHPNPPPPPQWRAEFCPITTPIAYRSCCEWGTDRFFPSNLPKGLKWLQKAFSMLSVVFRSFSQNFPLGASGYFTENSRWVPLPILQRFSVVTAPSICCSFFCRLSVQLGSTVLIPSTSIFQIQSTTLAGHDELPGEPRGNKVNRNQDKDFEWTIIFIECNICNYQARKLKFSMQHLPFGTR